MLNKNISRLRRAKRARKKINELAVYCLSVHKTCKHIYAQVFSPEGDKTCVSASTVDKTLRTAIKYPGNKEAAAAVGKLIAERAKEAGITKVAFDRSGFKYHGRIKALADAARESGLEF